ICVGVHINPPERQGADTERLQQCIVGTVGDEEMALTEVIRCVDLVSHRIHRDTNRSECYLCREGVGSTVEYIEGMGVGCVDRVRCRIDCDTAPSLPIDDVTDHCVGV